MAESGLRWALYRRATTSASLRRAVQAGLDLRASLGPVRRQVRAWRHHDEGRWPARDLAVADWFVTSDGRKIPVYDRYRYDTKPGWQFFRPLHDLALVRTLGGLTDVERTAVDVAIGTRRVGLPLDEIEDLLTGVARRTPDSFLWSEGSPPLLKPTRGETERRIWRLVQRRERQLRAAGFRSGRNRPRVLEIGYTSGGHSLAAFERLGFEVTGIDNYYDGVVDPSDLPHFTLHDLAGATPELLVGDVAAEGVLDGREFDLVFSESVVEHLRDLESALRQCGRLTAPGGMAIHSYEPYHSLRGGHGLGTLDAPFGHVRVDVHDHERYLFDQRGFEAPVAVPWVANALNRCSQSQVRDAAEAAGVPITFWRAIEDRPPELTVDIEAECLAVHPQIRPHDLLATEVLFGCLPGRDR